MKHANKETTDRLHAQAKACAETAAQLQSQAMMQVLHNTEPATAPTYIVEFDERMRLLRESRKWHELSIEFAVTAEYGGAGFSE